MVETEEPTGTSDKANPLEKPEASRPDRGNPPAGAEAKADAPSASFASMVKRPPLSTAIIIFGEEADLTEDQLDQIWRVIDAHLTDLARDGTFLDIGKSLKRDGCLFVWPNTPAIGETLLELLPKLSWGEGLGKLTFAKEGERPRTRRHRVWVPGNSSIRSGNDLRQIMLRRNPDLPANGLVFHEAVRKQNAEGSTIILGLSDEWMRRYPSRSTIYLGLCQLTIVNCHEENVRPTKKSADTATKRASTGAGPKNPPAKQKHLPPSVDPHPGKAIRSAEGGQRRDRRPARSTRTSGLVLRALESASQLRAHLEKVRPERPRVRPHRSPASHPPAEVGTGRGGSSRLV